MSTPSDPTQFTRESAERIANVVRAAELAVPQARPLTFDRVEVLKNSKLFRVCTFTGAWEIGSAKEVTFINVTSTPNTASALNLFTNFTATAATTTCAIAKEGTAWYLVAPSGSSVSTASTQSMTVSVLTGASLSGAGLQFTTAEVVVLAVGQTALITIGTTDCA
jgi:hypothetical protein